MSQFIATKPEPKPAPPPTATNARQALTLAVYRSIAVLAGSATMGAVLLSAWLFQDLGHVWIAVVGGIAGLVGFTFTASLWAYTTDVRRNTWQRETATNTDIDGDGVVGRPTDRTVRHFANGKEQDDIDLGPDPHEPVPEMPVLEGLEAWDVTRQDVQDFIERANRIGLSEATWERLMPQKQFRAMRKWLGERGYLKKAGAARNSPWELASELDELISGLWKDPPPH